MNDFLLSELLTCSTMMVVSGFSRQLDNLRDTDWPACKSSGLSEDHGVDVDNDSGRNPKAYQPRQHREYLVYRQVALCGTRLDGFFKVLVG